MRLRSSQFVFLMLLVCTVQLRAEYASQLFADAGYAGVLAISSVREVSSAKARGANQPASGCRTVAAQFELDAAARFSENIAWHVRRPALDSTAISSFTGFLRA